MDEPDELNELNELAEYGELRLWKCGNDYHAELWLEIPADGVDLIAHESKTLLGVLLRIKMTLAGMLTPFQNVRSSRSTDKTGNRSA